LIRRCFRFALLLAVALTLGGAALSAQQSFPAVLERFLARTDEGPRSYRALRHMEAQNEHFGASAWMDVWTDADQAGGFRYQIAREGGSAYIRRRVFLGALEAEQKMWQQGEPKQAEVNHTNYSFADNGVDQTGLVSVTITPKRKDVLLVDGWIFVRRDDGDLVRIEGRLSKTPSFWTRHVEVVRRYARVAGVHVPVETESTAQVLIAGRSTFRMTYEYETINGMRVGNPEPKTEKEQ